MWFDGAGKKTRFWFHSCFQWYTNEGALKKKEKISAVGVRARARTRARTQVVHMQVFFCQEGKRLRAAVYFVEHHTLLIFPTESAACNVVGAAAYKSFFSFGDQEKKVSSSVLVLRNLFHFLKMSL